MLAINKNFTKIAKFYAKYTI